MWETIVLSDKESREDLNSSDSKIDEKNHICLMSNATDTLASEESEEEIHVSATERHLGKFHH